MPLVFLFLLSLLLLVLVVHPACMPALPLLLSCIPCTCILFVCRAILPHRALLRRAQRGPQDLARHSPARKAGSGSRVSLCVGVIGVVVAGAVVGILVGVVALAVGTATGAVVVSAGVVWSALTLACFLDLPFCLYVFPYPWNKGLPPPRTKDAGMTST